MKADDVQALSIDYQINEILEVARRDGLNMVEIKREAHSSQETGQRPAFNQMLAEIQESKLNAILTWVPDRLSRNAGI